ncbi:MAG: ABC transporter permease [Chloroflexi bacterium]|nr:MAG: ABC transporter permease [Chloroflexota bacterium]
MATTTFSAPAVDRLRMQRRRTRRQLLKGLFFISPWIIGFCAFSLYPILASFYYSLTSYTVLRAPRFIGLSNYQTMFFEDNLFWVSLYNTIYYTIGAVGLGTVAAIAMALMLNMKISGQAIYRTIFYLPSITPVVAASIVWLWIFNSQYGMANSVLRIFGVAPIGWLSSPTWSKPSLILMAVWGLGGAIVIYLAGLQDVPAELYEAAQIDGANGWQQIRNITLPMLTPVILFNVVTGLIGAFQYFTQAYIMTNGGPGDTTLMYSLYLYRTAFEFFKMGYGSALAWFLLLVILGCTYLILRTSGEWVYYAGGEK